MPLILAVDRDRRQATLLVSLVRKRIDAELVQGASAAEGIDALAGRVPDLILTSSLLSPKDDGVLAGYLRELGPKAAHVQTLTIPVLRSSKPGRSKSGVMSKLRRDKVRAPATDGCDPAVFADEIELYLTRATEEQQRRAARDSSDSRTTEILDPPPPVSFAEPPAEVADPPAEVAEHVPEFFAPLEDHPEDAVRAAQVLSAPPDHIEEALPAIDARAADAPSLIVPERELVSTAEPVLEARAEFEPTKVPVPELVIVEPVLEMEPVLETAPVPETETVLEVAPELEPAPVTDPAVDNSAELAAQEDAIASAVNELRDPTVETRDLKYPSSLEEALAAVTATLTALENTPQEGSASVAAPGPEANISEAPAGDEKPHGDADVNLSVPLDRLVALFADMERDSANETSKPPEPVLDEESLALIGDAARKASLNASASLEPPAQAAAPEDAHPAQKSAAEDVEIDLSGEIDAIGPEEPEKSTGEDPSSAAQATESKDSRGKKKPRRRAKGPIQDEWGLFDPDQCGFSALVDKLDEVTDATEEQKPQTGTRVRVISY